MKNTDPQSFGTKKSEPSALKFWLPILLLPLAVVIFMPREHVGKISLISLLLLLITLNLVAQPSGRPAIQTQLLADPNVTWVGEFYSNYRLDPTQEKANYDWNELHIFKWASKANHHGFGNFFNGTDLRWKRMIMNWIENNKVQAYEDALLTRPVAKDEVSHRFFSIQNQLDTFTDADRMPFMFQVENIIGVRVRWLLYFSKKDKGLHASAVSCGPLVHINSEGNKNIIHEPVLWFGIEKAPGFEEMYNSENISYIVQVKSRNSTPRLEEIRPLKGTFDFKTYIEACLEEKEKPLYSVDGDFELLDTAYLNSLKGGVDTLVTYDPVTHLETTEIVKVPPALDLLRSVRIVSNWFFDENKGEIYCQTIGFAPVYAVKNGAGKDLYWKAMFYMRE